MQRQRQERSAGVVTPGRDLHVPNATGRGRTCPCSPGGSYCGLVTSVTSEPGVGIQRPEPFLPDYGGACLTSVVASVVPGERRIRPAWAPPVLARRVPGRPPGARRARLGPAARRLAWLPNLAGGEGGPITSVVPTTTATALTSPHHRSLPGRTRDRGLPGRAWTTRCSTSCVGRCDGSDARLRVRPGLFQPHRPLARCRRSRWRWSPEGSSPRPASRPPISAGVTVRGWSVPPASPSRWDELWPTARGSSTPTTTGSTRWPTTTDSGALRRRAAGGRPPGRRPARGAAPRGGAGGHGRPRSGRRGAPGPRAAGRELMDGVELLSGEGRFRWLHARPGAPEDAWPRRPDRRTATRPGSGPGSRSSTTGGSAGPLERPGARTGWATWRCGPVAPVAFLDPADTGESRLMAPARVAHLRRDAGPAAGLDARPVEQRRQGRGAHGPASRARP